MSPPVAMGGIVPTRVRGYKVISAGATDRPPAGIALAAAAAAA